MNKVQIILVVSIHFYYFIVIFLICNANFSTYIPENGKRVSNHLYCPKNYSETAKQIELEYYGYIPYDN